MIKSIKDIHQPIKTCECLSKTINETPLTIAVYSYQISQAQLFTFLITPKKNTPLYKHTQNHPQETIPFDAFDASKDADQQASVNPFIYTPVSHPATGFIHLPLQCFIDLYTLPRLSLCQFTQPLLSYP